MFRLAPGVRFLFVTVLGALLVIACFIERFDLFQRSFLKFDLTPFLRRFGCAGITYHVSSSALPFLFATYFRRWFDVLFLELFFGSSYLFFSFVNWFCFFSAESFIFLLKVTRDFSSLLKTFPSCDVRFCDQISFPTVFHPQ